MKKFSVGDLIEYNIDPLNVNKNVSTGIGLILNIHMLNNRERKKEYYEILPLSSKRVFLYEENINKIHNIN
tara:strand:+ start:39 stop:251 length:213 start_codon:yes stop_codon:yes gene_type:complete